MNTIVEIAEWMALDLGDGRRSQIEASAGTGKTWTISVLYLRLLLERGLSVRQIVVATFSDAAAQELRERIRQRLFWAERCAQLFASDHSGPVGEADARYLRQRWQSGAGACGNDLLRLRLALAELDLAPIATLHGLCVRILGEHPFVAGSGFELGTLIPEQELRDELLADLKRQLAQSSEPIGVGDEYWLGKFELLAQVLRRVADAGIRVDAPRLAPIDWVLEPAPLAALRAFWARVEYFKRSNSAFRNALARLIAFLEVGDVNAVLPLLTLLADRVIDGHIRPELIEKLRTHPAIDFAARAAAALVEYQAAARAEPILRYRAQWQQWRQQRLRERGLFTYDALIERVHAALGNDAVALADALHAAWPLALIDEFQDTDARQYAILDRIYRDAAGSVRGCLVMIGDPKQAIYAFRGGDIHTYRRALGVVDQRMSLATNHRSSRAYIDGLNAFYALVAPGLGRRDAPETFDYLPVTASTRRDAEPYCIDGQPVARPLVFHFRDDPADSARARTSAALQCCAWQIAGLLNDGTQRIGDNRIQPGDIAVLLPSNRQIAELRDLLVRSGVPCAGVGQQTVFDTEWARDLQVVLYAIAHCDDAPAVRAALSSRLYGWDAMALRALAADTERWQDAVQSLHALQQIWQRQGVLAVVQRLIDSVAPRLQRDADYERTITDLRHLGELLQEASERLHGATQLLAWLERQRRDPEFGSEDSDEQQLRIESDAARVRLMTLHASKGLEFRIVFLPLLWAQQARAAGPYPLVVDAGSGERVVDLGTAKLQARAEQAACEDQDERFRILYVALTRAEYACHVYALPPSRRRDGRVKIAAVDPERSALDALIERMLEAQQNDPAALDALPGIEWRSSWPLAPAYYRAAAEPLRNRIVESLPALRAPRSVHSFSTLVRQAQTAALEETAALDESVVDSDAALEVGALADADVIAAAPTPHPELLALDALRGAELGNALHAIFEHRERGVPVQAQLALVRREFAAHDVGWRLIDGDDLLKAWAARIDAALASDLGDGLRLLDVPHAAQCAEMEFHFVVQELPLDALRRVCAAHGDVDLIPIGLGHAALNGLVTGKIDLVLAHAGRFHVLDYKGNALGSRLDDYRGAALSQAMAAHHYRFQALLYVLAVDRMLAQRLHNYRRDLHLGDAIYLFVRAAGLAPAAGVWRHRFDSALIEDLQQTLAIGERAR